jgi:cytochrome P450
VNELEPFIRETSRTLLDDLAREGSVDWIASFAALLPATVITSLMGFPSSYRERIRTLTDRLLHREPGDLAPQADAAAAGMELYQLLADLVQERRANPADDMATALVQVEELDDHQIAMFYVLLAVAGYETTAKLLGNLVVQLQEYPEQRRLVIDDRTLASNAVEESLRYDGPAQYQLRITTEPVVLHGHEIPSGSHVVIVAGAANRDEREFPDPDVFDLKRDAPRHLAFGHGIHFCLGASLARIEAVVALEELLDRFPDYEVDLTGLERRWSSNFRGLSAVPIRLS